MHRLTHAAATIALTGILTGCAAGGFDPISQDNTQQFAGVERTEITFADDGTFDTITRTTGRNVQGESFAAETTGDGVRVSWGVDTSENVASHKARAGVAITTSEALAEAGPELATSITDITGILFPGGI